MKSFAKLGLLLALVIAGRYLRLTEPASFTGPEKTTAHVAQPDTLRFASYATTQMLPLAPVSQRSPRTQQEPTYLGWY